MIKFCIDETKMRPKVAKHAISYINKIIILYCGDCIIEAPEGYLTKEDLE